MSQETETKYFSLEEIKKNTGENGSRIWFIYKDIVYDVTEYVEEHPGGSELVVEWAGKDATKAFDDAGHSSDAKKDLKPYKIGELALEDRKTKESKKKAPAPASKKESKGPKVVDSIEDSHVTRSCLAVITCGICA